MRYCICTPSGNIAATNLTIPGIAAFVRQWKDLKRIPAWFIQWEDPKARAGQGGDLALVDAEASVQIFTHHGEGLNAGEHLNVMLRITNREGLSPLIPKIIRRARAMGHSKPRRRSARKQRTKTGGEKREQIIPDN